MEKFNQPHIRLTVNNSISRIIKYENTILRLYISSIIWFESLYRDTVNVLTIKAEYPLLDFCLYRDERRNPLLCWNDMLNYDFLMDSYFIQFNILLYSSCIL